MRLTDYLAKRCSPNSLSQIEASIFRIPHPLRAGWVGRYAEYEADEGVLIRMRDRLAVAGTEATHKALRGIESVFGMGAQGNRSELTRSPVVTTKTGSEGKKARRAKRTPAASIPTEINALYRSLTREQHAYIISDAFLASFEWRQLRIKVLRHHGAKCMCCGATPASGAVMHVDHIKPRRRFPQLALDFDNLQVLCEDCNHGKANDVVDFRPAAVAQA